jgi:hypothetical protein
MNVAVVEPASHEIESSAGRAERETPCLQSEWIDPEGNDWLSAIYRELTRGASELVVASDLELEHWFG